MRIKVITSLISIHLYLQKLSERLQLRTSILPPNHVIKFLLEKRYAVDSHPYHENMTFKQCSKIRSSVTNANNWLSRIFPPFDSLNSEFFSGLRLIDTFSSHFSFYKADHCNKENKAAYCCKLDDLAFNSLSDLYTIIVSSNASIRNNIATSITHIYSFSSPIKKTLHHAIDITTTEAESDVRLIMLFKFLISLISLLSLILYIWCKELNICPTLLNSGIVLMMKNSLFMYW